MKRTRKWSFVAQEAIRLAELGLSPIEIARRLEVQRSTVTRWMAAGKVQDTRRGAPGAAPLSRAGALPPRGKSVAPDKSLPAPGAWAAAVRAAYALDATDDALVTLGEAALVKVHDPTQTPQVQLNATGRFIAIVKHLALVARAAEATPEPVETPPPRPLVTRRAGADPRTFLQAVK